MAESTRDTPNILWICTDQQRWDTLGCYGNEFVETPTIDSLAETGTQFDRTYCQSPFCSPSRASFLTGRYPRTTGVRTNGYPMPVDETPVTQILAESGYTCGLAGKLHLSPEAPYEDANVVPEPARRVRDGYASFHWSGGPNQGNHREWLTRQDVTETTSELAQGSPYVSTTVPPEYTQTMWCADRTIDFIETHDGGEEPWLFSVNPFDPHAPWTPPASYLERYRSLLDDIPLPTYEPGELDDKPAAQQFRRDTLSGYHVDVPYAEVDERDHRLIRAAYWAMCDLVDDAVARMLAALDRTGQREDTIVIFTSDHGEMLGDHAIYNKGVFFYEGGMRVPLIIDGPGFQEGVNSSALVELTDIAPTLLEAAGVDAPLGMQGRSLYPLLRGKRTPDDHRQSVYAEHYLDQEPAREQDSLYTMIRTDKYKLVRSHGRDEGELYDLATDPDELNNRWDDPDYLEIRADLLAKMTDRMAETADPLPEQQGDW